MKYMWGCMALLIACLNIFGGFVSGVWLLFLGEWATFGLGVVIAFGGAAALGTLLMPTLALAVPAAALLEGSVSLKSGSAILGLFLVFLSSLYTAALMTSASLLVFHVMTRNATEASLVPSLLWAYSASTGPWAYMARAEQRGEDGDSSDASARAVFFLMMALIAMMLMILLGSPSRVTVAIVVAAFMAGNVILSFLMAVAMFAAGVERADRLVDFEDEGAGLHEAAHWDFEEEDDT